MRQLFLYLDESGNFESDNSSNDSPSLIGGVLSYDQKISIKKAWEILENKNFHSCEVPHNQFADFSTKTLKHCKELGWQLVIFENKERLEVVDGDTTYLNIISEGLTQLLLLLYSEVTPVKLNVNVAVRKAVKREDYKNRFIIKKEEYIKRLQEKIIISLARRSSKKINEKHWSLELASARNDPRLMLADIVCHSWFRKNKKFNLEQKQEIEKLYYEDYIFNVFPNEFEANFYRLMNSGNIGDAAYEFITSNYANNSKYLDSVIEGLKELNEYSRELQLEILFNKLMNLLKVDMNKIIIHKTINTIKNKLLHELEDNNITAVKFQMDIYLLEFTLATNRGDIQQAEDVKVKCEELIPKLVNRWESIDTYFIFNIRKGVHLINKYDLKECIKLMNELDDLIENTLSLFPLSDAFSKVCTNMKSDIKGKVLGNRLQARTPLIRNNLEQLELARKDSNAAFEEFRRSADINRQYQYRCRIEYEAGNYKEAITWLAKSLGIDDFNDFNIIIKTILNENQHTFGFSLMHYVSIMVEAYLAGDKEVADKMFNVSVKNKTEDAILKVENMFHPYEIIFWKIGTYLMLNENIRAAIKKYNQALEICEQHKENQTIKAITLGIKAEKVGLLAENNSKNTKKDLINSYYNYMNSELPLTMTRHFLPWRQYIDKIKNKNDKTAFKKLYEFSKQIIY